MTRAIAPVAAEIIAGRPPTIGDRDRHRERGEQPDARVDPGDDRERDRLGDQRQRDDEAGQHLGAQACRMVQRVADGRQCVRVDRTRHRAGHDHLDPRVSLEGVGRAADPGNGSEQRGQGRRRCRRRTCGLDPAGSRWIHFTAWPVRPGPDSSAARCSVGHTGAVTASPALEPASLGRPWLGLEVLIVLAISRPVRRLLGAADHRTADPWGGAQSQTSTLNASVIPDRPWLDLAYQLVGIAFAVVPPCWSSTC